MEEEKMRSDSQSQPRPGEIRVINGQRCRFIERELEGDKWEVLGASPPSSLDAQSPDGGLEPDWPISTDGAHPINDTRRWLARQLMDSKLSEDEALGIVAFHPAVSDHRPADAPRALTPLEGELLEALKAYDNAFTDLNPDDQASRFVMRKAIIAARAAILKAEQP